MPEVFIPIRTRSLTNAREHWSAKHRRARAERHAAYMMTPKAELPCTVRLTRVAPRKLDSHDNLRESNKNLVDGIADRLETTDNDPRITWEYAQERGKPKEYGVRVEIE